MTHFAHRQAVFMLFHLTPHASRLIASAVLCMMLAACGFQPRGTAPMPFESLYVQAPSTSQLAIQLRRAVRSNGSTQVADRPEQAQVILQIMNESEERQILTITGAGRVSEYQLRYRVQFRLTDAKNREHIAASEIVLRRDHSYNDDQALARDSEQALLYRDMRNDAVQQLVRRMQSAKLQS
jgi:LPS-assembly lipoprotein